MYSLSSFDLGVICFGVLLCLFILVYLYLKKRGLDGWHGEDVLDIDD